VPKLCSESRVGQQARGGNAVAVRTNTTPLVQAEFFRLEITKLLQFFRNIICYFFHVEYCLFAIE
jgi:hypothetical protein